jgi:hypothetical protein
MRRMLSVMRSPYLSNYVFLRAADMLAVKASGRAAAEGCKSDRNR